MLFKCCTICGCIKAAEETYQSVLHPNGEITIGYNSINSQDHGTGELNLQMDKEQQFNNLHTTLMAIFIHSSSFFRQHQRFSHINMTTNQVHKTWSNFKKYAKNQITNWMIVKYFFHHKYFVTFGPSVDRP